MFFEFIDIPLAKSDRHGPVQCDTRLLGQDEISESNLTESDDKICCRFKIFEVCRDDQQGIGAGGITAVFLNMLRKLMPFIGWKVPKSICL